MKTNDKTVGCIGQEKDGAAQPPVACNLNTFDAVQGARYRELIALLRGAVISATTVVDGFSFELNSDAATCLAAMEFVTLERRCCTFLTFRLELAPQGGSLTLTMTGPKGTKEVLDEFVGKLTAVL